MKKFGNTVLWGFAAVAILAAAYLAVKPAPVLVDTAEVEAKPMVVTISEEGETRVSDIYTVASPIAGKLDRISLREGDQVSGGKTLVALIQPLESPFLDQRTRNELTAAVEAARSAVALAQVELQRAKTAFNLAESEYSRAYRLAGSSAISESSLEQAYSELQLQKAQVSSAEATIRLRKAELTTAEARLIQPETVSGMGADMDCCVSVLAPVDGVVLDVFVRSEQPVTAGARLLDIGDTGKLEVVVELLSRDAVAVRPGTRVIIDGWGGEQTLSATVRRVDPAAFTRVSALGIEEQRVNVIMDLDTSPPELGHAYRVYTRLVIWESEEALQVPLGALFRHQGQWAAFIAVGGKAKLVTVKTGRMNDSQAEVLEGLAAGDRVIVYPSDLLEDGSLIEAR